MPEQAFRRRPTAQQAKFATLRQTFRSGLEEKVAQEIEALGYKYKFECFKIPYERPAKAHNYTPDLLLENGIVIETKGLFDTADRQKMILVRAQHPDIDIRMVFSNANARIAKKSKTTYAMWCDRQGYRWAHRSIPKEWLEETVNLRSVAAVKKLLAS